VIGCGSIGKRHTRNLLSLGVKNIVAFDVQRARRAEVEQEFGIETLGSLDAAWAWRPYVCLVTAPTSLHVNLARSAVEQGAHVFIEKPLSHEWVGVERLLDLVARRSVITLVGCNLRFHPGLRKIQELLRQNAVGRVIAARVAVGQYLPDWHPWEDYRKTYSARRDLGGGVILDAIHEIDYVRWLLGEVTNTVCFAGKLSKLEIDTEDTAAILLRFQNGAFGEVHLDYVQRAYSRTCQIIGDEGTIHWDFAAGQVRFYSSQDQRWSGFVNPAGWEMNQMYLDEMAHFLSCIDGREAPESNVFDAAKVLQIALAAKASATEKRWIEFGSPHWQTSAIL
jgi:predicted dehydrogenase